MRVQFSIRNLLCCIALIAALFCATRAHLDQDAFKNARAIAALERDNVVWWNDGFGGTRIALRDASVCPSREVLRSLRNLSAVTVCGPHVGNEALVQHLGEIVALKQIDFVNADRAVIPSSAIAQMPHVKRLRIRCCIVDRNVFNAIAKLPNLESLTLIEVPVSDEDVRILSRGPRLRELSVQDGSKSGVVAISSTSVSIFEQMRSLREVCLEGRFSAELLTNLGELRNRFDIYVNGELLRGDP